MTTRPAAAHAGEGTVATPDIAGMLARAGAPWLAPVRERLASMRDAGKLPHALLLLGQEGAGQSELAIWLAARLLCERAGASACGSCGDCRLTLAGTHPDFQFVGISPDTTAIRIDQIRALSEVLSFRSYRGRSKVAVIDPADAMNINSFNALLKTLEEPTDNTFLVLAATRSDRLPATVVSRCARVRLPLPPASEALDWLSRTDPQKRWECLLPLAGGAPFLAVSYADAGLEELDAQMQAALDSARQGRFDVIANAAAWAADQPQARLFWLEAWLTSRLREAALPSDAVNNNRLPWLRAAGGDPMIRAGYRLLDALREARQLVGGSLNTQLMFEGLLVSLGGLLGGGVDKRRESVD